MPRGKSPPCPAVTSTTPPAILVVGLDDPKSLDPKLLHLLAQPPVLGAHVLPVEVGRPETEGGAARLREPGLDGGGDDREDVAGHRAVPPHLEREEQQASRHQGAEQYNLPNLHLPTPREKARNLVRRGSRPFSGDRARRGLGRSRARRTTAARRLASPGDSSPDAGDDPDPGAAPRPR